MDNVTLVVSIAFNVQLQMNQHVLCVNLGIILILNLYVKAVYKTVLIALILIHAMVAFKAIF